MYEKVVVNKKIAQSLEYIKELSKGNINEMFLRLGSVLFNQAADISGDVFLPLLKCGDYQKLFNALQYGYKVEEEYKVGDWIVVEDCPCERIIGKVQKIKDISKLGNSQLRYYYEDWWSNEFNTDLRRATPEEIKVEQERRVWAKIGREPGDIRDGDVGVMNNIMVTRITDIEMIKECYEQKCLLGIYPVESFIEFGGMSSDK